jgi:NitT/TauT family transport system substrate-binding protein
MRCYYARMGLGREDGSLFTRREAIQLSSAALITTSLGLAGCSNSEQGKASLPRASIGLLPIIDCLPVWVGIKSKGFERAGLGLSEVTFRSATERDAAFVSRDIDLMLNDMVSLVSLAASGHPIKVVSVALGATPAAGPISVVLSPKHEAASLNDLRDQPIALSRGSVVEYVFSRLAEREGLQLSSFDVVPIPQIDLRIQAVLSGDVSAAVLPEPAATIVSRGGGKVLVSDADGNENISQSVLVAQADAKTELIASFRDGWDTAVAHIEVNSERATRLLTQMASIPADVRLSAGNLGFAPWTMPSEESIAAIGAWMIENELIDAQPDYAALLGG